MAVTASIESNEGVNESGKRRRVIAVLSYAAEAHSNGYSVPKELFGYQALVESLDLDSAGPGDSRVFKYDEANETIRIYASDTAAEIVAPLTESVRVKAIGY